MNLYILNERTTQDAHDQLAVREPCLEWATVNGPMAGVWGGTTEEERATERRRRGRVNAAARRAARERAAANA